MRTLPSSGTLAGAALGLLLSIAAAGEAWPITAAAAVALLTAAGLLAGAGQAAMALTVGALARRLPLARDRALAIALWGAILASPGLLWAAMWAFSGRYARTLPGRPALIVLAAGLLAGIVLVLTFLAVRHAGPMIRRSPWHRWWAVLLALSCSAMVIVLDRMWLVRRYDLVHVALGAGAFLFLQAAVAAGWYRPGRPRANRGVRGPLIIGGVVAGGLLGGWHLNTSDGADLRRTLADAGVLGESLLDVVLMPGSRRSPAQPGPTAPPARTPMAVLKTAPFPGADVVLVTVDALRADHLGLHGHRRPTSPRLDELARRAVVFESAYAPAPHTSFSIMSMLSGRYAWSLGGRERLDGWATLADGFRGAGYRTLGVFPPAVFYVQSEMFAGQRERRFGFEEVHFEAIEESRDARARTDEAIRLVDAGDERPMFLWVHYFGPHEPYIHHPELGDAPFGRRDVDRYDEEILEVDRHLGRLLDHVARKRPGALVVVSADHGEEFGEHGGAYHGTSLFEEQVRVPLIVALPTGNPRRVSAPVSTVDIAPTLLSLTGVPWSAPLEGQELTGLMAGQVDPSRTAFAELDALKMVRRGSHKLLCDVARDFCRLFDLAVDPGERQDLSARAPQVREKLRAVLLSWLQQDRAAPANVVSPSRGSGANLVERASRFDAEAVARLPELLRPAAGGSLPPPELRRQAAELMARLPHPRKKVVLASAMERDEDPVVRLWAAIGLALEGRKTMAGPLLRHDPGPDQPLLRAYRALALEALGRRESVPELVATLPTIADASVRCALSKAVGRTGGESALRALQDAYPVVRSRICVARALVTLRDPAALDFIRARLGDEPYTHVRAALAEAAASSGGKAAVPALLELFRKDTEEAVVATAARKLVELGAGQPVGRSRAIAVPPDARELWLVPSGKAGSRVRVWLRDRTGQPLRSEIVTGSKRMVFALALPDQSSGLRRPALASGPRGHALFR